MRASSDIEKRILAALSVRAKVAVPIATQQLFNVKTDFRNIFLTCRFLPSLMTIFTQSYLSELPTLPFPHAGLFRAPGIVALAQSWPIVRGGLAI